MNRSYRITMSASLLLLFLVFLLAAYQRQGVAAEAGQEVNRTVEKATKQMEQTKEKLGEEAEKAGKYVDDTTITAEVKAAILNEPLLKESRISVTTTRGVVKLSGSVDSKAAKDKSMEIARGVNGVKSVKSKLVVKAKR